MGKRFSRVRYLIKTTKAMGVDISGDDNIKAYKAFRAGDAKYDVAKVARGSRQPASLVPFCVYGYTSKYVVGLSSRSKAAMATNGVTEARLNIDLGTTNTDAGSTTSQGRKPPSGFKPAKALVSNVNPTGKTTPKSQILLLEYTKIPKTSFTYPFGKQDIKGQQTEPDMRGYLYADVARGNRTISFVPERGA